MLIILQVSASYGKIHSIWYFVFSLPHVGFFQCLSVVIFCLAISQKLTIILYIIFMTDTDLIDLPNDLILLGLLQFMSTALNNPIW